jgi:hypothetical protein
VRSAPRQFDYRLNLVAAALAAFAVACGLIVRATGGAFGYTLDDPYIHLRLSEMVSHGTYGINLGESASPSSSIIWPLGLVPFARTGLHEYVPLLINIGATTASLLVLFEILSCTWTAFDRSGAARFVLTLVVALSLNWFGLAFTGMEHSVHVLLTLVALLGLVRVAYGGQPRWWLWPTLALGPLVRYEGLAVSAVVLVALATRGHVRRALQTGIVILVAVMGFSLFLRSQGLPALPSSVLVKSGTAYAGALRPGDLLHSVVDNVSSTLSTRPVALLWVVALVASASLLIATRRGHRVQGELLVTACAAAVMCVHVAFGQNGWHERYEIYALTFTATALLVVGSRPIEALSRHIGTRAALGTLSVALLLVFSRYVDTTLSVVTSARSIYDQQHQMHVFVVDYLQTPVAVNDLGEVSYRNPYYVVDLGGLASETARIKRQSNQPRWMEQLVDPRRVPAALIYAPLFEGQVPDSWVRIGTLDSDYQLSNDPTVTVYATSPENVARVRTALTAFAPDVKAHTTVHLIDG